MSQTAISRIWRVFGLHPHRQKTFKGSVAERWRVEQTLI
jgi:hypothetical protein